MSETIAARVKVLARSNRMLISEVAEDELIITTDERNHALSRITHACAMLRVSFELVPEFDEGTTFCVRVVRTPATH